MSKPYQEDATLPEVVDAIRDCLSVSEERTARVADLLLAYAGPPSPSGIKNGSDEKLRRVADEVRKQLDGRARTFSSLGYLQQLRATAQKFPPSERSEGDPFSWMIVAGDPATLKGAKEQAEKDGRSCSAEYIRKYRASVKDQNTDDDQNSEDDQNEDEDAANALVRLREFEARLAGDTRFYTKFETRYAEVLEVWSDDERAALKSQVDDLARALSSLKRMFNPAKSRMREAAE
jgi:hypothetical protein